MLFNIENNFNSETQINQKLSKIDGIKNFIYYILDVNISNNEGKQIKILHLSDTHFDDNQEEKYVMLEKEFKNKEYDLIIFTGDIVNKSGIEKISQKHLIFLRCLKSKYGKYYTFGNYEHLHTKPTKIIPLMASCGFINLTNKYKLITIEKINYSIYGLDDSLFGIPDTEIIKNAENDNNYKILMLHNLDGIDNNNIKDFNLILSGHLHSGEINLKIFDGIDYLMLKGSYKNINKHKKGLKLFSKNTISFIHPGMHSHVASRLKAKRIGTHKEGIVEINLNF